MNINDDDIHDRGARLRGRDQGDIEWYYREGVRLSERSQTGAILDRASLFGHYLVEPANIFEEGCQPTIARLRRHHVPDPRRRIRAHAAEPWDPAPITARPNPKLQPTPLQHAPDDMALVRAAAVGRTLMRVERADPMAARVLCWYHGDVGATWALPRYDDTGHAALSARGRLFALFPLTEIGRSLLAADRSKADKSGVRLEVRDHDLLENVATRLERAGGLDGRRTLHQMHAQARALYRHACRTWNHITSGQ